MAGFDSIFSEVSARLGNRSGMDSRVTTWVNDAYFELMLNPRATFHEVEKSALLSTEIGTIAYELPDDMWFILNVRDETNGREIVKDRGERSTAGRTQLDYRIGTIGSGLR